MTYELSITTQQREIITNLSYEQAQEHIHHRIKDLQYNLAKNNEKLILNEMHEDYVNVGVIRNDLFHSLQTFTIQGHRAT
jgi:hypothetical protein